MAKIPRPTLEVRTSYYRKVRALIKRLITPTCAGRGMKARRQKTAARLTPLHRTALMRTPPHSTPLRVTAPLRTPLHFTYIVAGTEIAGTGRGRGTAVHLTYPVAGRLLARIGPGPK